nr:DUF4148 domain-containing protein [Paucibacter sp. M5-1]MCZ7883102.1 DUF4148 domain-containing protein [Paucibacter sp. M5-1]
MAQAQPQGVHHVAHQHPHRHRRHCHPGCDLHSRHGQQRLHAGQHRIRRCLSRHAGGKTRAEVRAELQKAREDGSLAKINSEAGYAPEAEAAARRPANVATLPPVKLGAGQIQFEAPAAGGGRTRAEVLEELRRAREDGSLRRMNTNRGY